MANVCLSNKLGVWVGEAALVLLGVSVVDWVSSQEHIYFSQFRSLGSPRPRCPQIWCLVSTCFPVHRPVWSSCSAFTHGERVEAALCNIFTKTLISFVEALPSLFNHLAPPPNTIALWVEISTYQLCGGYTDIWSIAKAEGQALDCSEFFKETYLYIFYHVNYYMDIFILNFKMCENLGNRNKRLHLT